MSIAQLLSALGPALMGNQTPTTGAVMNTRMPGIIGGFGGGTFDMDGTQATPVDRPAMPAILSPVAQQTQAPPKKRGGGLRDTLGRIGDYLLQENDMAPIYAPRKAEREQQEMSEALAQYIGMSHPEIADLVRKNPEVGMKIFGAIREDRRFDRTHGLDERRVGVSEGQLGLGYDELGERIRSNQAGEEITQRGQDVTSTTQIRLQQMRMAQAAAGRAHAAAVKALEGGGGYEETIVETPGRPAKDGWFSDDPGEPKTKTVTRRPIQQGRQVTSKAQYDALPSGATFEYGGKTYRKP